MLIEALAGGAFTKLMEPVVNETFITRNEQLTLLLPLAIVGLFMVRGIAGYVADTGMARAGRSISRDLRVQVLGKYLRLPGLRFDAEPVPSMLVRLSSDSDQVSQAAVDALKVMVQQSLQVLVGIGVMLWTSWQVTMAILIIAPPLAWVMDKVGRRYRKISHRIQESGAQLMQSADQA
ncbi:MAG: lipid ABC transporter permease/ATP-binding protein, partial [Lysobacter sp.]|nr:lipid ABC transporter permease/ATP-binding protein [Lysobacter sp.]